MKENSTISEKKQSQVLEIYGPIVKTMTFLP